METDVTDLRISEVADEIIEIQHAAALEGDFEIDLGTTFTDPKARAEFSRCHSLEGLRHYRLRDVTLDASTMLLVRDRQRIAETRYLVPDSAYADMLTKPLHPMPLDPAEHYIIGGNRAWHNYFHWMVQAVPAIDIGLRHANHRRVTIVLPPDPRPWQEETLALLGYQDVPRYILHGSGHFLLQSAEFSELVGARGSELVARVATATYKRMSQAVPWTEPGAEEIYVARTDSQNRIAENEAELMEMLQRQGVSIVVPGSLTVSEQIATFRAARLVIGPHGAGMSNIVFCRPGSFVYEMLPRHYPNFAFNRIAQASGLNYVADMFESFGPGGEHERLWRIDPDLVAARLDAIRAKLATRPRMESAMEFLRRPHVAKPQPASAPSQPTTASPPPRRGIIAALGRLFGGA